LVKTKSLRSYRKCFGHCDLSWVLGSNLTFNLSFLITYQKSKMNYKTILTRYKLNDHWIVSESFSLEESLLSYRKLLKSRLIKDRPQRFSFQYRFKHQSDWIPS